MLECGIGKLVVGEYSMTRKKREFYETLLVKKEALVKKDCISEREAWKFLIGGASQEFIDEGFHKTSRVT